MNFKKTTVALVALLSLVVGCGNAPPSVERVQSAIEPAVSKYYPRLTVKVNGIQADAQGNAATANLTFSGGGSTARGTAKLSHYTDGRWVITDIESPGGSISGNWEIK